MISSLLDVMLNEGEIDERDKLKFLCYSTRKAFIVKLPSTSGKASFL